MGGCCSVCQHLMYMYSYCNVQHVPDLQQAAELSRKGQACSSLQAWIASCAMLPDDMPLCMHYAPCFCRREGRWTCVTQLSNRSLQLVVWGVLQLLQHTLASRHVRCEFHMHSFRGLKGRRKMLRWKQACGCMGEGFSLEWKGAW